MKSRDASKLEEYVLIPEVDKDEVTAKKTEAIPEEYYNLLQLYLLSFLMPLGTYLHASLRAQMG